MTDYIKREDAKELLWRRLMQTANNNFGFKAEADRVYFDAAERITSRWIDEIPAADVVEKMHGKWIHEHLASTSGGSYPVVRCSECKCSFPMSETNYCPNCGTDMRSYPQNGDNCEKEEE